MERSDGAGGSRPSGDESATPEERLAGGGGSGQRSGARGKPPRGGVDFPLRILVSSDMVGAIIGRGGATIRNITQESRARVDVHRKMEPASGQGTGGQLEKAITVYGQPENCSAACRRILEVMAEEAKSVGKDQEICLKILAHNNLIGRIIGKQGATIKKIMEETSTKITVSPISDISSYNLERVITIRGSIPDISKAEAEVSNKLRSAYEMDLQAMAPQSVMFPGLHPAAMMATVGLGAGHQAAYHQRPNQAGPPAGARPPPPPQVPSETTYLFIPNAAVGAIIGTKGSHIRNIIKFSGSSVKIAAAEEEAAAGGSSSSSSGGSSTAPAENAAGRGEAASTTTDTTSLRKVTVVGTPESQWKAQYLIFEKLREEGFNQGMEDVKMTVEIMVPSSQVGRIIGKGGQNVREMQRLTGAIIKLPEQGTSTGEETSVHIVGTFYATQSAQRRIRAMVAGPGAQQVLPNGGVGGHEGHHPHHPHLHHHHPAS